MRAFFLSATALSLGLHCAIASGLDFGTYLSIRTDMTEGEVLASAGQPTLVADQGFTAEGLPVTTYSYIATPKQPYTTTVTLVGGRVSAVERNGTPPLTSDAQGLTFGTYLSIRRDMAEGEVLAIAGRPDLVVEQGIVQVEATRALLVRTYTYLATAKEPATTTITFVGGRVENVERRWKF